MTDEIALIDREVEAAAGWLSSPALRSAVLAETARAAIADTDRANDAAAGRDVAYRTFVDGASSDRLDAVRPDGEITAVWSVMDGVIETVLGLLRDASPVLTGAYRDAHAIVVGGAVVADAAAAAGAAAVVIVNTRPYARRIERGWSAQAPDGVYEGVAAIAAERLGNQARIRFIYAEAPGLAPFGRSRRERAASTRNPAISIEL